MPWRHFSTEYGRVREIAKRVGATPAQVALAWVLAQASTWCPFPAPRLPGTSQQRAAADVELGMADLAELDALAAPEGGRY